MSTFRQATSIATRDVTSKAATCAATTKFVSVKNGYKAKLPGEEENNAKALENAISYFIGNIVYKADITNDRKEFRVTVQR